MEFSTLWFHERSGPPKNVFINQAEWEFWPLWDYVIDGKWLAEHFAAAQGRPVVDSDWTERISPFGWTAREFQEPQAQQFVDGGRVAFPPSRARLLVCPIDGDPLCGSVSIDVRHFAGYVEWTDLEYDWFQEADLDRHFHDSWLPLSFRFDAAQYQQAFADLLARIQVLPSSPGYLDDFGDNPGRLSS